MSQINHKSIDPNIARRVIEVVGSYGTPPEYGFQYFTVGLDDYLNVIEREYLNDFIFKGGCHFKMVIGIYGGGKTHFLYCVRELAWRYNYVTSYIILTPKETPFSDLARVYRSLVTNLQYPKKPEELLTNQDKGIESIIRKWHNDKMTLSVSRNYESSSFTNAVKEAFNALEQNREEDFSLILQWLRGENPPKRLLQRFRIFERIESSNAFGMIKSLIQWLCDIGYRGLIVFMDEAEQRPSMSSKQKDLLLSNLRNLIDECGGGGIRNSMWFYAVPNTNFLEGKTQIYVALKQRLETVFNKNNPTGVKIDLEDVTLDPIKFLTEIGEKLAEIYQIAYNVSFDRGKLKGAIDRIAKEAYNKRLDIGYKRSFVQAIVQEFHKMKNEKGLST